MSNIFTLLRFALLLALASTILPARAAPVPGVSQVVSWNCTGSPCPWGTTLSGQALVWPEADGAGTSRFGYTVSRGIYLPASKASGLVVSIESGSASFYAGRPDALSHRVLATVTGPAVYQVVGLAADEVLSVQASGVFSYVLSPGDSGSGPVVEPPLVSQTVRWTCATSPCPWGSPLEGQAIVWPASASPIQQRLGYAVSAGAYLPATYANGMTLEVLSGTASAYAGQPGDASHRLLATLVGGGPKFVVSGLASGEVLSVQSGATFTFAVTASDPSAPGDPADPPPSSDPPPSGGTSQSSLLVLWSCSGSWCPWGTQLSGQALVWPSDFLATSARLGYSTSAPIYLPAERVAGVSVTLLTGSASAYAGHPDAPGHRLLGSLVGGQAFVLPGLSTGEVISIQGDGTFTYRIDGAPTGSPPPQDPPPQDPPPPDTSGAVHSIPALWRCNIPACSGPDWTGGVINWPAWAAYESNGRGWSSSRTVYSTSGELLYPYMGGWAQGCEVTAVSGDVLIIEWQRGTDIWRETRLAVGQTHVINLQAPEDGAMIESNDVAPFSVKLKNCTPQPIR